MSGRDDFLFFGTERVYVRVEEGVGATLGAGLEMLMLRSDVRVRSRPPATSAIGAVGFVSMCVVYVEGNC